MHKNSGVLNRLFAVLVDGGEYQDPANADETLVVNGLGFNKATNLFWRTHQTLTPTSQYLDLAIALQETCEVNIGEELYLPNVFNISIIPLSEVLTGADCDNVAVAITGSGMSKTIDFCPNIDCQSQYGQYGCTWKNCPAASDEYFYEDYQYTMGNGGVGKITPVCTAEGTGSSYAR